MRSAKILSCAAIALGVMGVTAGTAGAASQSLVGTGSTLMAPLADVWASTFRHTTGIKVTYEGVDSTNGVNDMTHQISDFAATDEPLNQEEASNCSGCVLIPWGLSAVGITYHLNGVRGPLKLTGSVLAQIYLGQIKRWNSARIKALNPAVRLPSTKITPVYRNDGAGSTYVLSSYLSSVSPTWNTKVGTGSAIPFPAGDGAQGDFGVVGLRNAVNGSIAYVAVAYLEAQKLPAVALQNAAHQFVFPNLSNIEAAGQTASDFAPDHTVNIINPPATARAAYPLSTFTYAIASPSDPKVALVKRFIQFGLTSGQAFGPSLDFAKLPASVLSRAESEAAAL